MSRTFKIIPNYYEEDIELYKKKVIEFHPGVTVLIGCNGAGKTTLLRQIEYALEKNDIPVIKFDNLHDGGSNARSEAAFYEDFTFLATSICSSEGENIIMNMNNFSKKIGRFFTLNANASEIWILLDAIDSGLSVDGVDDLKKYLFETIFKHNQDKEVYIICSANEYELARGEMCLDVINGEYISIKDYEEYRNMILNSRKLKDERYRKEK